MIEDQVADILANLPRRISDVVKPWAERSPDHPALVESGGPWSYGQLALRVSETQAWLQNSGVRPGDRVMIVCENCKAFVAILLAVAALDAWPVLVNARLSAPEVDKIRDHSGARLALYTTSASPHAAQHAKRHGAVIAEQAGLGAIGISEKNENTEPEPVDGQVSKRVAALIYTSGTTGLPKGVMLTHRGLLFVAAISARIRSLTPDDRLYGVLPMSHAVGLSVVLLGTLLSGGTLFLSPRFDPRAALAALENDKLTILLGAPSMFSLLLDYVGMKGRTSLRFPALRIISSSGAPLQLALKSSVEKMFGLPLHNGYGITECSPNISQTRVETPRTDTSVGRILPGMEARLVGSDGQEVADGEVGELWVRGPNIMKGYYHAPEETAAAVNSEGWFNSRDLARIEDGHLFIVGRTRELIVRFGLNVYPAEVEAALNTHPSVVRSAVIGRTVNGAEGGEEVVAFVQPTPGSSLQATELVNHLAEHLAPYKRPSHILLVSTMPVTLTGKVMKDELAKMQQARFHHDSVV
jgi:long-chain acyl-CoA synthetase